MCFSLCVHTESIYIYLFKFNSPEKKKIVECLETHTKEEEKEIIEEILGIVATNENENEKREEMKTTLTTEIVSIFYYVQMIAK
jgi:Zn-finger protein